MQLQKDLKLLENWADEWVIKFIAKKCHIISTEKGDPSLLHPKWPYFAICCYKPISGRHTFWKSDIWRSCRNYYQTGQSSAWLMDLKQSARLIILESPSLTLRCPPFCLVIFFFSLKVFFRYLKLTSLNLEPFSAKINSQKLSVGLQCGPPVFSHRG